MSSIDYYVVELGSGFATSLKRYLARTHGMKPYQMGHSEVIQEILVPLMQQLGDNLRHLSDSRGDWSFHVYRVRKVRKRYRVR